MKNSEFKFIAMSEQEAICIVGGVDKGAQDALYMIGYALGVISKVFTSIISLIKIVKK